MEILNKIPITEWPDWIDCILVILIILMFMTVLGAFMTGCSSKLMNTKIPDVFFIIGIATCVLTLGVCIGRNYFKNPTGRYQYEVTIDDSVPFNEVMERYNIVSQRGEIYVLEEK